MDQQLCKEDNVFQNALQVSTMIIPLIFAIFAMFPAQFVKMIKVAKIVLLVMFGIQHLLGLNSVTQFAIITNIIMVLDALIACKDVQFVIMQLYATLAESVTQYLQTKVNVFQIAQMEPIIV